MQEKPNQKEKEMTMIVNNQFLFLPKQKNGNDKYIPNCKTEKKDIYMFKFLVVKRRCCLDTIINESIYVRVNAWFFFCQMIFSFMVDGLCLFNSLNMHFDCCVSLLTVKNVF